MSDFEEQYEEENTTEPVTSANGSQHGLHFWSTNPDSDDFDLYAWVYPDGKDPAEFAESLRELANEIERVTAENQTVYFEDCQ